MHSSVSRLTKSQEEIAHVVNENILVINIARVEMSESRQALTKIIGILANLIVKLGNIAQGIREGTGVSSWTICTIIFTFRFYYTGTKKNSLKSKLFCGAWTVTIKNDLTGTPFIHQSLNP